MSGINRDGKRSRGAPAITIAFREGQKAAWNIRRPVWR